MAGYPFDAIERRWQQYWEENKTFRTPDLHDADFDASKPKYYVLDMFPYPSGSGLHVGHPEGYTATDIVARYKRMKGFNVLHPMGWDAFGLPAEQYAIETGTHPAETTAKNIDRFREQLQRLGFSYDWDREVNTTDPSYYKWTQWIFLKLYERGLAYESYAPVNWCPALGTVLSNEEVIDGKSERGGHPVVQKPMRQWMLKITEYADELLEGLEDLDWSDSLKEMQRNWIGKSIGAEVDFKVNNHGGAVVRVFTTRPDTLFGATFMVLAPDHALVEQITSDDQRAEVKAYVEAASRKSERERMEQRVKTGVFTGAYSQNPVNGEPVPIWVADYVLSSYGTGAIMAVPGQDERDWEFAEKFGLPIIRTVQPPEGFEGDAYIGDGPAINSDASAKAIPGVADQGTSLNGLNVKEAKAKIIAWLQEHGVGRAQTNYKLRDWLFSRQRYWGEPFPIVHVDGSHLAVYDLPVTLPEVESYKPSGTGESPLSTITDWVETRVDGKPALRETNTMPQWAGSCWYYLRYIDSDNPDQLVDPEKEKYWMPVDLYVGGAEHAVLHLLYARFWHKVLYDEGLVSTKEPFQRLVNQGMILGEMEYPAWQDASGAFVSSVHVDDPDAFTVLKMAEEDVEKKGDGFVLKSDASIRVDARAHKMSKSRGNVVNPDDIVDAYGADSLRLYEMFMGPLEQVKPWSTRSVEGVHRFLARAYRLMVDEESGTLLPKVTDVELTPDQLKVLHATIKKVTEDIDGLRFNTAISAMMEFVNAAYKWETVPAAALEPFILLLAPFAPHVAEELWSILGHETTLAYESWPAFDESLLVSDTKEIAVQVNGKVRGTATVAADASKEDLLEAAKALENVQKHMEGKTIRKEIVVPGRLVNIVVG